MKDLSFHILDIARNSIQAGATCIEIELHVDTPAGILRLVLKDNGKGMPVEMQTRASDPFFTTSGKKRVGLGLPLLKMNAEQTGGSFQLVSEAGKGTEVTSTFMVRHPDMIPAGDFTATFANLIGANPAIRFVVRHRSGESGFDADTEEIRQSLGIEGNPGREGAAFIARLIGENLSQLESEIQI